MVTHVLWGLVLVLLTGSLIISWRNSRVFKYRMALNDDVLKEWLGRILAVKTSTELLEVSEGHDRAREILDSVTYNQMLLQFWRPLNSFYKDEAFAGRVKRGVPRQATTSRGGAG